MKKILKKFIKTLTKNLWVKLFCLFAAGLLWIYVAAGQNSVGKFPGDIQIKAVNVPSELVAVYTDKTVQIKIMADSGTWRKLSADTFSSYVDLSAYSQGTYEVLVNVTSSIAGVQIVEKTPATIFVTLEPVIQKEVSVEKKIEGSAAEGFVVGDVIFDPDKITINGPKSIVNDLNSVIAEIKLNNESNDFSISVSPVAYNGLGEKITEISYLPDTVTAKVSIIKGANSKTVGIKAVSIGQPKEGFYVSAIVITPPTLDITGATATLADIIFLSTVAVDISNISADLEKDTNLNLPVGVSVQKGSPSRIHLKFRILPSDLSREIIATISPKNLSGWTVSSYSANQIKVTIAGPSDVVNSLQSSDVVVTLDFSSKTLTNNVNFDLSERNITSPARTTIVSVIPSTLSVALIKD